MTTESRPLRSLDDRLASVQWDEESPLTMTIETRSGMIQTRHGRFRGGRSDGVEIVEVDTGSLTARILPTRGMSIWEIESGGTRFGWHSPVDGPVHPNHVPVFDPSGLGWLEGFDELVVRCGLESNGAPEIDETNQYLRYPLHGRIGNLPADSLSIEFDEASGRLDVIGEVLESRLFFKRLRLKSRLRFQAGSAEIDLLDDVTNELSQPTTIQMLYHINVGTPVLGEGATLDAPIATLAPKDGHSAEDIERWNICDAPTDGFHERVFFSQLVADDGGKTDVMLKSADEETALGLRFGTKTLPQFVVWKNMAAESDGYVMGLEPATNFPNTKSFEAEQDRVVSLDPGQSISFRVTLTPMTNTEAIQDFSGKIAKLGESADSVIHDQPVKGWSDLPG